MSTRCPLIPARTDRAAAILATVLALGAPLVAQAQATPVVPAPDALHGGDASIRTCLALGSLPTGHSAAAIGAWLAVLGQCQRDPVYLAGLGQRLNQQGRYLEASEHLERALMFDPDLKGARVDYAIALAGSGDAASAFALMSSLLAEPDLPPSLRASLQHHAPVDGPGWDMRTTASVRLGRDSNLRGAPNLSGLTLSIAGLPVLLPLDESYQARSGPYARADLQIDARRNNSDGSRWDILANLRARRSPSVSNTGATLADLVIERSHLRVQADGSHEAGPYVALAASVLSAEAGTRYQSLGGGGGWSARWHDGWAQGCQGRLGGEYQQREHRSNAVLSGHYAGLSTSLSCDRPSGAYGLVSVRAGRDLAQDSARPGGDQNQASLRLAGYAPMPRGGLLLDAEVSHYRDSTGYSPLLENGAIRSLNRQAWRVEYQHLVAPKLQWAWGFEWIRQSSSIALFGLQSRGPYAALRSSW